MEHPPGRNPLLCDAGTHVCTPLIRVFDGELQQYWTPADAAQHGAEWRDVPRVWSAEPVPVGELEKPVPSMPDLRADSVWMINPPEIMLGSSNPA